ncbi:MMPL family transporter [Fastidiosibacter lacustris]|uniref:MMPL family transporter n=1 Tax=Fastidiosibacter lacustris TaxID=2056695 RepID=UPI000E3563D0|nr:MMPL family transporter [Fastidiosibacter lacustris]
MPYLKQKHEQPHFLYRLWLWLILSISGLIGFIVLVACGLPINTNILSLLPGTDQSGTTQQAAEGFANNMGKQIIVLIGNPDQQKSLAASDLFTLQLKHSGYFESIINGVNNDEQQAWASFYFPYRLSLLSASELRLIKDQGFDEIENKALFNLYNPIGITSSKLLENDPFSLFQNYIFSLPKPSNLLDLHDNHLMSKNDGIWYTMINATLKDDSFSLTNQSNITALLTQIKQEISAQLPNTSYLMTGMIFYAKAGTDSARHDVSIIGIGSLIGIILLVLVSFRSLSPLLLTLFSSAMGFVFAFVITYLVFGKVFLFTLVFGASLIGISVDYAFFYYADQLYGGKAWRPKQGLKRIFSGITLGLINIVIAYLIIAVAPFPGLRQLAVFAISGLFMSYLTVVALFPYLLKPKKHSTIPIISTVANYYLKFWQSLSIQKIMLIYTAIIIIAVIGIIRLQINDDIRILESTPISLKQNEQQIKSIIGSDVGTNFIIVTGRSSNEVIQHEHALIEVIKRKNTTISEPVIAISEYLPDIEIQKENYDLVRKYFIQYRLLNFFAQIGVDEIKAHAIQKSLLDIQFKPLTIDDWLHSTVSQKLRFLWLGQQAPGNPPEYASVVLLSQKLDVKMIKNICQAFPFATFVNKADDISNVFKTYRQYISVLFFSVFIALFLLLLIRYKSFKKAFCYFLPPTTAVLLSIATLGLFYIPMTLFNVLALILVLGIAVDYVLFFAETKSTINSTMLAVTLSAITTILSFGLLAFSQTPAIHYFGLSVFIGITTAFLLSPLAAKKVK